MNNINNKKIVIIIVIVVISLALLLGIGYFVSQNFINKSANNNTINNNPTNDNNDNNSNKIENISLANKIFQQFVVHKDYLEMVKNNFSNNYKTIVAIENTPVQNFPKISCDELFKNDNYKVIDGYYYDGENTYGTCDNDIMDDGVETVENWNYQKVNETYAKMFGKGNATKNIVSLELYHQGIDIYAYSTFQDSYVPLNCNCGGTGYDEIYHIYEGNTNNNELHIVFGFIAYFMGDVRADKLEAQTGINNYVTLSIETNNIDGFYEIINIDKVFENQKDKFDLYEMVLTKNNNDYIFKSLNKVNS